jgi:hypothetical protein
MRDWVRGYTYSDTHFQNTSIRYNGVTDATLYGTSSTAPYGSHASHDVGMAFDLGFKETVFLNLDATRDKDDPLDPRIAQA